MTHGGGLILAAPASGSGKTLLTLGLLRLLRDRGVRVAAAKAGPDYIDPTFHAAASGGVCLNLDAWAMRKSTLRALVDTLEQPGRFRAVRRRDGPVRRHRSRRRGRIDGGARAADRLAGRTGRRCAPAGRLGRGAGGRVRPARSGDAARRGDFQPGRRVAPPCLAGGRAGPASARAALPRRGDAGPRAEPPRASSRPGSGRRAAIRDRGGNRARRRTRWPPVSTSSG